MELDLRRSVGVPVGDGGEGELKFEGFLGQSIDTGMA